MRSVLIAAAMLSMGTAAQAGQQRIAMHGPGVGARPMGGMQGGQHWGGRYQGHWVGGMRAPGGWGAYRRPIRGYSLPRYWFAPNFYINDWAGYGLAQPPVGYTWTRYYDDAVLVDGRGSVYDSVSGIPWDQYDLDEAQGGQIDAYHANSDSYYASQGAPYAAPQQGYAPGYAPQPGYYPPQQGYAQPGAPYAPPPPRGYYDERRSNGVGGAVAGAAVGGVAGGLLAGRHDKVGGALLGAGAGAIAGYAIDRGSHHRRDYAPPPYAEGGPEGPYAGGPGAPYPMPGPGGPYGPPPAVFTNGGTTVTSTTVGGPYPGSTLTTVTVASAPVVTTTTEVWEDTVTYTRPPVHKVYRKRVYRPRCGCR